MCVILNNTIHTVFMSPELAISSSCHTLFSKSHIKKNLALVAIDEVHCVLDWLLIFNIKYYHNY